MHSKKHHTDFQARYNVLRGLSNDMVWMAQEGKRHPDAGLIPLLDKKESAKQARYLSNGFVGNPLLKEYDRRLSDELKKDALQINDEGILHLIYSNWFWAHPEKVCGTEYGGTGIAFPVLTKGKVEDIVAAIEKTVGKKKILNELKPTDNTLKLKLKLQAQAKAQAILILMDMENAN